jgi:MFS family permease
VKRPAISRKWLVLVAVSLSLLFGSGTTFPSMGVPLFAMAQELHWSNAAAGSAFLTLGVVTSAFSLAPMVLIPRIGARWTVAGGMALLAVGFFLASAVHTLWTFYIATALFGCAFALVSNASGTYLIASWFQARAASMMGLYMMIGNLGGALIPPLAGVLVGAGSGWRFYWQAMAAVALAGGVLCALLIREPPDDASIGDDGAKIGWGYRTFLPTPQFLIITVALIATQACMIIVAAVATPHMVQRGWTVGLASQILGLQGLVGVAAAGAAGWLTARYEPRWVLALSLLAEAVALALFAFAHTLWTLYAFVPIFGAGCSISTVAGMVMLINYFGNRGGTAAQSTVWTLCGFATAGPYLAGLVADRTGSFVPPLVFLAVAVLPIAAASVLMKSRSVRSADRPHDQMVSAE